jgi:hypothetical protein
MTRRPGKERNVPRAPAFLVAAANTFVGVDLAGIVSSEGRADAAFVNHVGRWSHFGGAPLRTRWPIAEVRNAAELAERCGRWLTGEPLSGDLFLLWDEKKALFTRIGIVVEVLKRARPLGEAEADVCQVIEGGSSADAEGRWERVVRHVVRFKRSDRFVRWTHPKRLSPGHVLLENAS